MSPCPFESRLAAYHDGELPRPLALEVERHLPGCNTCRAELAGLRGVSSLFAGAVVEEDLTGEELERLHTAIDAEPQRAPFSLAAPMLALAASVLVICGVWLMALPAASPHVARSVAPAAEWERMAMTLQAEPRGFNATGEVAQAQGDDQRLTAWMVESLGREK